MDKYIKEIKVFTFPELNGEAKEKAKEWYLNDETLSWELTDSYESDLSCIFPNSDLKVQWSLSYCQGDGVNIYGSVNSYCSGWLNAYASFSSYHADFTAVLFANMKSIKRNPVVRYVVKNIKWDTDGDQESFDSLPQEVILPAKFSKENYKDENGIFGKAEKIEMLDDISDWLSNGYGFCNNGFELTQKEV